MRASKTSQKLKSILIVAALVVAGVGSFYSPPRAEAACATTAPATTYGVVTQTVNVATAGTYRVWSRVKAPNTTANSYYLRADSANCWYDVGDSTSIPASTWTWVNYQDGSASSTIDLTLTAGSHTLTYTGKEADVQLDRVLLLTDTACLPTGTGDNCAVNDTTSPTVSVTAPASGATVSGTTSVTANAADASGVSKVEFLLDGTVTSTDTTSPYAWSWNTTSTTNGSHTLTARATDNSTNTATSTAVNVTVSNTTSDTTAPTVSLTAPATGTSVSAGTSVTLSATASDNVGVSKVEFYNGTTLLNSDTTSPYSYAWNTTGVAAGTKSLTAKAYDAAGNTKVSTAVSLTVTGTTTDTTPPTVSVTAPTEGQNFVGGTSVTMSANASDNVGVTKVEFYTSNNTTLQCTATTAPFSCSHVFATTTGPRTVNARAYDAAGNVTTSATVNFNIVASTGDTTPPVVSMTATPTSVTVGGTITTTATASDNIGVTKVEFYNGTTLLNSDTTAPYSFAWNTTGVATGTKSLTAKAYDAAANFGTSTAVSVTVNASTSGSGDANGDGRVNAIDLSILLSHDGQNYPAADFNGDGTVGAADMAILLGKWTW